MRVFWLWISAVVVIWPIHYQIAEAGGKPVDLMLSDFYFVLMPFTYLLARSRPTKAQIASVKSRVHGYHVMPALAAIFVIYCSALAAIGVGLSGETIRLYSAFKLTKPVGYVLVGWIVGAWTDPLEFIEIISRVYGIIVGMTMFCTVTNPDFPLGEWGKYIFEYQLNGYPNMPMSTYAALVPLLLATADAPNKKPFRVVGWGLAACTVLIILGSMSRSSTIVLVCSVSAYLVLTGRAALLGVSIAVISFVAIVGLGLFSLLKEADVVKVLSERVTERFERSTESEDPTSGRLEIWVLAIELATEKPIFGYQFEPFSRYYHFDTPHQQYLEVLYKAGGLGLFVYLWLIASCFIATKRLLLRTTRRSKPWYLLHGMTAMLFGLLLGNLTQPNFTYSLTGNAVFLLFGSLCSSRAVLSAANSFELESTKSNSTQLFPMRRVAA